MIQKDALNYLLLYLLYCTNQQYRLIVEIISIVFLVKGRDKFGCFVDIRKYAVVQ